MILFQFNFSCMICLIRSACLQRLNRLSWKKSISRVTKRHTFTYHQHLLARFGILDVHAVGKKTTKWSKKKHSQSWWLMVFNNQETTINQKCNNYKSCHSVGNLPGDDCVLWMTHLEHSSNRFQWKTEKGKITSLVFLTWA